MISHVTTGVVALMAGELTARNRIVASVVRKRLIGLVIMALLPMMPTYWLDAMCYLLRSTLSRGSAGVQPPLTAGIVQEEPGASTQVAPAAGLVIPGALFGLGQFGLTFFAAAGLQSLHLLYYSRVFRAYTLSQRHSIVRRRTAAWDTT